MSNTIKKNDPYSHQRRDWGKVKPYSVEFKDKSKYSRKQKHKKGWEE